MHSVINLSINLTLQSNYVTLKCYSAKGVFISAYWKVKKKTQNKKSHVEAVWHGAKSEAKKEKWRRGGWWKEGEQLASGSVTPGLASQQGVVLGARSQACCHTESLHRHTVTDRRLLAPGCITDLPKHCFNIASDIHTPLTELDLHHIDLFFLLSYGFR